MRAAPSFTEDIESSISTDDGAEIASFVSMDSIFASYTSREPLQILVSNVMALQQHHSLLIVIHLTRRRSLPQQHTFLHVYRSIESSVHHLDFTWHRVQKIAQLPMIVRKIRPVFTQCTFGPQMNWRRKHRFSARTTAPLDRTPSPPKWIVSEIYSSRKKGIIRLFYFNLTWVWTHCLATMVERIS